MKENLTELVFILDMSGSMSSLANDTIGGFNSMIESQKAEPGEANVTTVLFDHDYILLHDHVSIANVNPLTNKEYSPRGTTALLDAIGRTVNSVGARLASTPEEERPSRVVVAITTDGYENASREFTKAKIKEMIEHQQTKYSWVFMFLGANMDAISEAASLGIGSDFARTYSTTTDGLNSVYTSMSCAVSGVRSAGVTTNTSCLGEIVSSALDDVK